jgi:hypothetical protein
VVLESAGSADERDEEGQPLPAESARPVADAFQDPCASAGRSPPTGRIENAQVGVFLAYTSRHGHTLVDRRIYLPE